MLEEYILKLAEAIRKKDLKRRDRILSDLRKLGMDNSTALSLALSIGNEDYDNGR